MTSCCPLGQNQESLPLYQGPQIRYLKRSHFPFSFFTLPCLIPTLRLTHSPPSVVISIESRIPTTGPDTLKNKHYFAFSCQALEILPPPRSLIGRDVMLFPTSVSLTSSPEQQLLHNNLVKGWALSPQSKMCRMDMGGIFFLKSRQNNQN